ncbi:MAG TPA: hypothetical protein VK571_05995 [Gemmatimonadaceae bacterium]|nr:hypothetical protein [Gemmatimonadaceae bacterium]
MATPVLTGTRTQISNFALGGTTLAAPSRAVTKGDLILIPAFQSFATKQTLTISDGVNTYLQIGAAIDSPGANDSSVTFWYAIAATTATIAPQLNFGATQAVAAAIWFDLATNIDPSTPISNNNGQLQAAVATTTDAITSGTATPVGVRTGFLVYGFSMNISASAVPNAGTAFTDGGSGWDFGFGTPLMRSESKAVSALTPVAATFTATEANDDYITFNAIINGLPLSSALFYGAGTTS